MTEHEDPSPQTREDTTNAYDEMAGVARQILESVAKQQLTYLTKHRNITKLKEAGDDSGDSENEDEQEDLADGREKEFTNHLMNFMCER